jgi:Mn-dependent DtxR family transcriptional regulator
MSELSDAERQMLLLIFQLSKGDTEKILNRKNVSAALQLRPSDGERVLKTLTARRMIRYILFGSLCITEAGVIAAQSARPRVQSRIFVSYRRADSRDMAERMYDRLAAAFGRDIVFKDLDHRIPAGSNFRTHLQNVIQSSSALLVVIGREWLAPDGPAGKPRIDDPEDYVRLEIEYGLSRGLLVIPVLVGGATVPVKLSLPGSLRDLTDLQAVEVRRDPDFHGDMDRLIEHLRRTGVVAPRSEV